MSQLFTFLHIYKHLQQIFVTEDGVHDRLGRRMSSVYPASISIALIATAPFKVPPVASAAPETVSVAASPSVSIVVVITASRPKITTLRTHIAHVTRWRSVIVSSVKVIVISASERRLIHAAELIESTSWRGVAQQPWTTSGIEVHWIIRRHSLG